MLIRYFGFIIIFLAKKMPEMLHLSAFQALSLLPATGIEPVPYCYDRILSPARLPVPPRRHMGPTGLEPVTLCL